MLPVVKKYTLVSICLELLTSLTCRVSFCLDVLAKDDTVMVGLLYRIYEALHERQGKNPKELNVEKGDILQVMKVLYFFFYFFHAENCILDLSYNKFGTVHCQY